MPPEITSALAFVATALGIASLIISNRNNGLRAEMEALRVRVNELAEKLGVVESERDSLKVENRVLLKEQIEVLGENRQLRQRLAG